MSTDYIGWEVRDKKFNVYSLLSITAGNRLTKAESTITPESDNITTRFARHDNCTFFKDNDEFDWGYTALYCKHGLSGDNLGIEVIYRKSDLIKLTDDAVSFISIFRPVNGKLTYYFTAAWEQEIH